MLSFSLTAIVLHSSARPINFHAGALDLSINDRGYLERLAISDGSNLIPVDHLSPILQLRVKGKLEQPNAARWDEHRSTLTLQYIGHQAIVRVLQKATHLMMELVKVSPSNDVEVAVWGPYSTSIKGSIGETIGVVQEKDHAFGLQVLNSKTLGGFPNTEDDIEPSYSIFDSSNLVDISDRDAATEDYRGDTARPMEFGSVVQAYVRNRSKSRVISNWGHPFYTAPAYFDGGIIGSKIALFGSTPANALPTIGQIEISEGLPHPMVDGVWGKLSPTAHESYLVMGFDKDNLDECLAITKQAGLKYLYSDSCFDQWGHFTLNPKGFPKNWETMRQCVDRAKTVGVRLGVHTLSNFITPNDPYVTPLPDKRLAEVGASNLSTGVNALETEITIDEPKFFNEMANNTLRTVRVGNELIQYVAVSSDSPWRLLHCKRGAFGTKPGSYPSGTRIAKLMDHGYGTFLTNAYLTKEVATNLANLFNYTGLLQLSMDGLEGNWSTGMGQYGRALFAETWYKGLSPKIKGQVINDASNPGAFNWHINTRENWGEPWYAGFRKSQTLYRLKNQHYFTRNLMPGMLGWFQLTAQTTVEDIQWLLARAAGFDAGFCITTNLDSIHHNPNTKEILKSVNAWESARRYHAFPSDLISKLQDINHEFDLSQVTEKSWAITEVKSNKFAISPGNLNTKLSLPEYVKQFRLIIQVPTKSTFEHSSVTLDGKLLTPTWQKSWSGYQYLALNVSGLLPVKHELVIAGKYASEKNEVLDCEVRSPISNSQLFTAVTSARR